MLCYLYASAHNNKNVLVKTIFKNDGKNHGENHLKKSPASQLDAGMCVSVQMECWQNVHAYCKVKNATFMHIRSKRLVVNY